MQKPAAQELRGGGDGQARTDDVCLDKAFGSYEPLEQFIRRLWRWGGDPSWIPPPLPVQLSGQWTLMLPPLRSSEAENTTTPAPSRITIEN